MEKHECDYQYKFGDLECTICGKQMPIKQKQLPPHITRILEDIDSINEHVCMTSFDANSLRALAEYIRTGE